MLNDENIISKSRSIIDLRNVNLTIQEFRLMEVYLSKINPQDETTASVTFTKQEYCDLMEIQSRLLESKRLNKYMQHLFNNSVTEWLEDGESFEMHPLFEKAKFDKKNSTITLECGKSDYVRKMFFDISKNGYIKYALKNTLYLQSVYSIKLYLYLLENRFRSTWKIELDCLKGIFECTSDYYNDFRRFNSKILKTSIDEINEMTNVFVSYETIRKARKVAEIEFTCHFKDTNEVINGEFEEKDIPEDVLSTFETYCIKDGVSYAMNETKDELYAINSKLSDHDINTLLKSAINKHEFDAGDQVYLYADDDELHYHLEELFDQYLDAPDDFDFVSEEFENGLEQYQDEIGKNEMEL